MIEEKARELGRLMGQSKEYQELKRANEVLAEAPETMKLLKQMEQLSAEARQMIARGEHPTEDMERQLEELLTKLQVQPAYQRLSVSNENFDKLMMRVNDWIRDGIEKGAASPIIMLG